MRQIIIESGRVRVQARLLKSPTAEIVWRALPLFSAAEIWGALVHFDVPIEAYREPAARDVIAAGEIAFSPEEEAIAIAYGRTPLSRGSEIRLWSPSNVFAIATGDVAGLRGIAAGAEISIAQAKARPLRGAAARPARRQR